MKTLLTLMLLLTATAAHAASGDWQVGGNTAWIGRSDVNVQVTLTSGSCTGPNVAAPTQMIGPFTAGELRAISSANFAGSGQAICAHAFAYTGTGNATGTPVGATRSVEVTNTQSFQLGSPTLSVAP